jgi:hypothetical protein
MGGTPENTRKSEFGQVAAVTRWGRWGLHKNFASSKKFPITSSNSAE